MIGKVIDYQAKQVTYNIYTFFKKRKMDTSSTEHQKDINVIDVVAEATGLSKSSVTRIIREGNAMKVGSGAVHFKPQERKKHVRQKRIEVDEATETFIRRKVIEFYTVKNEVPSVRKLNALLRAEQYLTCSNEFLRQLLHKLGFTNADENDSTGMLREHPDIVAARLKYLIAMREFRNQNKSIFFLNDTSKWPQQDIVISNINDMPSLVIVHAAGPGFLDKAVIMMKMKYKSNKDNSCLDSADNYDWLKNKVFKNISASSVIILNVPYSATVESIHDEKITMGTNRIVMEEWLNRHNISFKETDSKADLLKLIKIQEAKATYSISKLLKENKHEVLHLPQNHSDLNPAAAMWDELKTDLDGASPKQLISKYSKQKWQACFERVEKAEKEYYNHDTKIDDKEHLQQLTKIKAEPNDNDHNIMDFE